MVSIIKSAKSIQEAIRLGCEELKCARTDVDIEVIDMGSNGIFGLFGKPAKVKLTKKADDDDFSFEMPKLTLDSVPEPKQQAKKAKQKSEGSEEKPAKQPKAKAPKENREPKPAKEPRAPKAPKEPKEPKPEKEAKVVEKPVEIEEFIATPETEWKETSVIARDFITELCKRMGVEVTVEVMQSDEQIRVRLAGENMSLLIGRRGETLDSIQYLAGLCVNRGREGYIRVSIDAENYRAKREEALRKLAVRMANKAKKSGKRVSLEPMNPYERRILHSALQDDPEVTTHSEGEEPYRRVIITLK